MERRAHRPYKSSSPRQMSRMERDLSSSPHNPTKYMNGVNANMIRRVLPKGRIPHVCIVGAGVSGLRCAAILARKGLKVTILEARDRIGGRVHQSDYLGHLVDLGPNWIHGADNNPMVDLAEETSTAVFPPEEERSSVYDESGQLLSDKKGLEISETVWGIIGEAFKYSNEHSGSIPPEMSLMDFFRNKVDDLKLDEPTAKLVLQMAHIWGDFVGEPIETQSLKYCWLEECIDEKNLFVSGTYQAILRHIAQSTLEHTDLQLSTKVISVRSSQSSIKNPFISITTATNETLVFDEVVVTAPLGWLKHNPSTFVPALPPRLITAISNMSYGRLEKVYLTFPTPFWTLSSSTTTNSNSLPSRAPFFIQFLSPNYASNQNPHRWTLEPVSLASLPPPNAHATLLFYLNGPCSQHVTSLISSLPPTSPKYHSILSTFFHPYYSRLPNYVSTSPSCQPTKILSTNWQNDEFAGYGSYTNFQISKAREPRKSKFKTLDRMEVNDYEKEEKEEEDEEEEKEGGEWEEVRLDKDIEALREGCPDRGVWFAGEHTAPFVALGTITGAYWSGEAVGRRIAAAYGIEDELPDAGIADSDHKSDLYGKAPNGTFSAP